MSKNILFLVSSMGTGGAERVAANLVNAWAARGDKVTLLVTYSGGGEIHYALSEQVRLCYLADEVGARGRGLWTYTKRFLALREHIRATREGIVVSFLTNVNVAALLAGCCLGNPIVVSERNYPPMNSLGWLWESLRKWSYRNAAAVVMQTEKGATWARLALTDPRAVVIPNPLVYPLTIKEPRLEPVDWVDSDRKLLLAAGRLLEQKGFDLLLQVFDELSSMNSNWDLVILGEGPLRAELESQVQGLELTGRVHLPGRAGNVGDWYKRADLYVMSSRFEGFPNTLGEAMAHGCAAVSYDCDTGPRDLIRHGVDGLLVNPVGDVSALAKSLAQLMQDDAMRAHMAAKATEVRDRYSMGSILAMWDKLFDDVTN